MNKVISLQQAITLSKKLKGEGKSIVLVGGCFDIFHYGHFAFLKEAKKLGDILIIALESDERVRKLKGEGRPITRQNARAEILSSFPFIDYVLLLPEMLDDSSYRSMTIGIKPDIIAATVGDKHIYKKQKQAERIDAQVQLIPHVKTPSTSKLLEIIKKEL